MRWIKVAKVSDLEDGKAVMVPLSGGQAALFRVDGKFYAIENRCGHRGGPLADGHCEKGIVTCPWHAWTFDVRTGACQNAPGLDQKTFQVKVEKDEVFLSDAS